MLDSDSIVLEKYNFVHEKSLKSPWISFLKKCGNHDTILGFIAICGVYDHIRPQIDTGYVEMSDRI